MVRVESDRWAPVWLELNQTGGHQYGWSWIKQVGTSVVRVDPNRWAPVRYGLEGSTNMISINQTGGHQLWLELNQAGSTHMVKEGPQSTYICREQSSVWCLPKYWPPTPSPPSECVLPPRGGQKDDFRPLTSTLGEGGMGCRDKYVTSWPQLAMNRFLPLLATDSHTLDTYIWGGGGLWF